MNLNHLIPNAEAAKILGVIVQTLANWRLQQRGPAYIRLGRKIYYRVEDLQDYILSKRVDPNADLKGE